jgi:hypothetical protein
MTSGIPSWKKNVHQSMTSKTTWRGVPVPWAALWSAPGMRRILAKQLAAQLLDPQVEG